MISIVKSYSVVITFKQSVKLEALADHLGSFHRRLIFRLDLLTLKIERIERRQLVDVVRVDLVPLAAAKGFFRSLELMFILPGLG